MKVSRLRLSGEQIVGPSGSAGAGIPSKLRVAHSGAWVMDRWAQEVDRAAVGGALHSARAKRPRLDPAAAHASSSPIAKLRRPEGVLEVDVTSAFGCPPRIAAAWGKCAR